MCGVAGLVNWGNRETLIRMTDVQAHRGPDDGGIYDTVLSDGTWLGLGSRRLAIVDRSPAGHMPMCNPEQTIWIVHNGEIYNYPALRSELEGKGYRFRSTSDTEVLLYLYQEDGVQCLSKLDGMFAFAIWDARSELLFLARDHFGVKPLYYVARDRRLAFASEVKALLEVADCPRGVDLQALHQYLTFLWVPDPSTLFEGIYKLPAGHYAIRRNGQFRVVQYWDVTFPPAGHVFTKREPELAATLHAHVDQAVQAQRRSDVPLGAFLSSGLDSSSIVATMAQAGQQPVHTYTAAFPAKYRTGEVSLDDPAVAARTAARFGCRHTEIVVEPSVVDLLPRLIWHADEPLADPALLTAYLVCREAKRTVTVLMSGVGGDELFAGYRKHYAHYWANLYREIPAILRRKLIEPTLLNLPSFRHTRLQGFVHLVKKMARSASLPPEEAFLMNSTYLDGAQKCALYSPDMQASVEWDDPWRHHRAYLDRVKHADFLNQMLYLDMKAFLVSLNLTYTDKMSMASSVEVRVPLLNKALTEFAAWQVPPSLKLRGLWQPTTKHIFRTAMKDVLPAEVLTQHKAGFGAPTDYWLRHDLEEMVHDLLSEDRIRQRGYFRPGAVSSLIRDYYCGRRNSSMQIWQLLTLELWFQTFVDRQGAQRSGVGCSRA